MGPREHYIKRCLELADKGKYFAAPNPRVGCVIVHKDKIIGEGYHEKYGEGHGEVNAIKSVKDKTLLSESTLYVNLEPCSYTGNTPPCCDLILKHQIPEVIIGTKDPNPKVAGNGIERLEKAGVRVTLGVLAKECEEVNKRFFTYHVKKRPYVILKWAQSQDGFIAPSNQEVGMPLAISGIESNLLVHAFRAEEHAILVGTNTAYLDNPLLTNRSGVGRNPLRIVLDRTLRVPRSHNIFDNSASSIVFTESEENLHSKSTRYMHTYFDSDTLRNVLKELHKEKILSVLIEGGAKTLGSFIDQDLWDEARVFVSKQKLLEGIEAPKLELLGEVKEEKTVGDDQLLNFKN